MLYLILVNWCFNCSFAKGQERICVESGMETEMRNERKDKT